MWYRNQGKSLSFKVKGQSYSVGSWQRIWLPHSMHEIIAYLSIPLELDYEYYTVFDNYEEDDDDPQE